VKKPRIPPLLSDLVRATLISFDGVLFDAREVCPHCGGEVSGYDIKRKHFAILSEKDRQRILHVRVKRFRCLQCGQVCLAGQPFYPDTRIGSPVVDLCIALGEIMPYSRVSSVLAEMGIIVDRWSVRNYVRKNKRTVPAADMFGIRLPLSIITLSSLTVGTPEGAQINPWDLLLACGILS
jgi:hypothetical protein